MAEKLYYSMGEVAEMFDVKRSLIRHWESQFSVLKPRRTARGNRMFTPQDVEHLKVIYHLVKERGMTLEGAKRAMKRRAADGPDGEMKREAELMTRLKHIRALLVEVREDLKSGGEGIIADEELLAEPASASHSDTVPARRRTKPVVRIEPAEEPLVVEEPACEASATAEMPGEEMPVTESRDEAPADEPFAAAASVCESPADEGWAAAESVAEEASAEESASEEVVATEMPGEEDAVIEEEVAVSVPETEIAVRDPWDENAADLSERGTVVESCVKELEAEPHEDEFTAEPIEKESMTESAANLVMGAESCEETSAPEVPQSAAAESGDPAADAPRAESDDSVADTPRPAAGAPKPRSGAPRRSRRKSGDDENKELFAFYEQSLF
ncbi:MerR family transcriptional regulator [uncultured Alistipes sp.]|uniref:MerR family transcriptional regulator n=1 Tax=uncultured Alistipes sp. TaxID=538949 RepID=UPI00351A5DFE